MMKMTMQTEKNEIDIRSKKKCRIGLGNEKLSELKEEESKVNTEQ